MKNNLLIAQAYFELDTSVSLSALESECPPSNLSDGDEVTVCIELNARRAARELLDSVLRILKGSELMMLAVRTIGAWCLVFVWIR